MSTQITTAFVQQYKDDVIHLAQQKESRLRATVQAEMVTGESAYFDRIGTTAAVKRTTRHGDTPLVETPHTRRRVDLADYEWADLVDQQDKVRMLLEAQGEYAQAGGSAMGRAIDDVIIAAATGTAKTGKDGSGSQTFPAGQQIAVNFGGSNIGLTIGKLIEAKRLLDAAEVDAEDRTLAYTAKQMSDLLNTTQITSSDYNTVKALVKGEIDTFLGFTFVHSERLLKTGSNRSVLAYQKKGLKLAWGEDVKTRITERDDKSYAMQVYLCMSLGAVRMEEERVVEILCLE